MQTGGLWNALKYSVKEADQINELFKQQGITTTLLKGEEATEEAFKLVGLMGEKSPEVMHISTHGYYFSVKEYEDAVRQGIREDEGSMFRRIDHPFIRTGLILAGGNEAWNPENKFAWMGEDGILTSYEISQLNLRHTQLVVLSSCESGLGDIHGDEGVFGLPRAFRIAGVKNLIFSLWQVPDYHTKELMIEFYHNLMNGRMPLRTAFRQAQQAMRHKGYEPYYWAGFVLME
ncbi:MAG: CHAT domain-containing protein [Saprospiraceae bacterium]|nr:CHAT domain-containing protein [Saprospiraceae bacterium]